MPPPESDNNVTPCSSRARPLSSPPILPLLSFQSPDITELECPSPSPITWQSEKTPAELYSCEPEKVRKSVGFLEPLSTPSEYTAQGEGLKAPTSLEPSNSPASLRKSILKHSDQTFSPPKASRLEEVEGYYLSQAMPKRAKGPEYVYGSYQKQPRPDTLPKPNKKRALRLPTRLGSPPRRKFSFDDEDLATFVDDSFEDAMTTEIEHNDINEPAAKRPTQNDRHSSGAFIEYYDLFVRAEQDPTVIYNIRTKKFRAEKRSSLTKNGNGEEVETTSQSLTMSVDNPPLLCDGRMTIVQLPKSGDTVTVRWRNLDKFDHEVRLRERQVELPTWVLTGRRLRKIADMFVERA
ncbi:uncharacterized protein LY89DRAFT_667265 [Mollisia scopiformis]|uniref:Uncharacterized protein n=1 Tax=Mollisia scopiformis TaxID=149040 RepID=A0A194XHN7_MOLSC|nr:uncharacterized protein LY89DRAFT_667265 [Mollisia scopiformis]KUJ19287.1 hypothetical protein LY89DRAFT_667265 [Mollisia scopiformis]